ncbi:MAG: glucose-6-phosphate dehydrogenase [Solirubrobacterales bacterium]|nr:glucose-6-phosphate dehydrogenase [Solirubrobacterales bacterium]
MVLFGATGDLARRKLLPGLFHLAEAGLLPDGHRIVGVSRGGLSDDEFRAQARAAVEEFGRTDPKDGAWTAFAERLTYVEADDSVALARAVERAEAALGGSPRRLHYLSVPPGASADLVRSLGAAGLTERARVILEKPFGTDLASAQALNATVHEVFDEAQVFRIDHFLGKEAVQNILALRFANGIFEPIWNRGFIDHVQIDVPETLSVGTRAEFYEATGAFRDMVVTHLFQVLGFVAMEPPTSLSPRALVGEKVKVFESLAPLRPQDVVRGQYEGYRAEDGVADDSDTETFVGVRAHVENWRWEGVPFYLRTGKRLAQARRVITIVFRDPPRRMFPELCREDAAAQPNRLVLELGDPASITTGFLAKVPGPSMRLAPATMGFSADEAFGTRDVLEAYERLIHDALLGDRTLFTRADGIERLWEVSAPALARPGAVAPYAPGSWGPPAVDELVAPRRWHLPDH